MARRIPMNERTIEQIKADLQLVEIRRLLKDIEETAVQWHLEMETQPTDRAIVDMLSDLRQALTDVAGPVD